MAAITNIPRILIVEDDADVAKTLKRVVGNSGSYQTTIVNDPIIAVKEIVASPPDLVFTDLMMPKMDGVELIRRVKAIDADLPVVVVSAYATLENAVEAVKAGAFDFLSKPFTPESVDLILTKLQRDLALRQRAEAMCRHAQEQDPYLQALIGDSPAMQRLQAWICKIRGSRTSVLIEGESGTGKELVVRAIHAGEGPFVALNMAAIPDDLAEAELFGARRGAFTGAHETRKGLLLEANGGTLFLDEVNAMSPAIQAKLLRVLQEKRIRALGGGAEIELDFQLVSASNQNLESLMTEGRFRRDLFHRLNVLSITLPPLRERREDIPKLAEHFLQRYARAHSRRVRRLTPLVVAKLSSADWPGNVRELENVIEQAVILSPEDVVEVPLSVLPEALGGQGWFDAGASHANLDSNKGATLAEIEWHYIQQVLADSGGNKAAAARVLGIDYKTLLRKLNSAKQPI